MKKLPADSEEDGTNVSRFVEDKIYPLLLAFESGHMDVFEFVLNKFSGWWPSQTLRTFIDVPFEDYPHWTEAITLLL